MPAPRQPGEDGPRVPGEAADGAFGERVTDCILPHLTSGSYDFSVRGCREMARDVMAIVDEQFPYSRVYTEIFF